MLIQTYNERVSVNFRYNRKYHHFETIWKKLIDFGILGNFKFDTKKKNHLHYKTDNYD